MSYNAQVPNPKGTSLYIPAKGKATPEQMGIAAALTPDLPGGKPAFNVSDIGAGRNVMNWGPKFSDRDKDLLNDLVGERFEKLDPAKLEEAREAHPDWTDQQVRNSLRERPVSTVTEGNLINFVDDWTHQPGSGTATRRAFSFIDKLNPGDFNRLDKGVRGVAGDLLDTYTQKAKSMKAPVREDLMNLLGILRDQGLKAAKQAAYSGGFVPAIALAILLGDHGTGQQPAQDQRRRPTM
jgi:hypothetical protein